MTQTDLEPAPQPGSGETFRSTNRPSAPPTPPPKNGKRKKVFLIGGSILLVVGLILGIPYYIHSLHYVSTDDAYIRAHITAVAPRVAQQIVKVDVLDNQYVKKGTLLLTLDNRPYRANVAVLEAQLARAEASAAGSRYQLALTRQRATAALDQATAGVQIAKAAVASALAGVLQAKSGLAQAEAAVALAAADVARAKADLASAIAKSERANSDYRRYRGLLKTRDVTPFQVDTYRADAITAAANVVAARKTLLAKRALLNQSHAGILAAKAQVQAADALVRQSRAQLIEAQAKEAAYDVVPQQVGQKTSDVSSSEAAIKQLKAQLSLAKLNLSYCNIYAPVSGYVTKKAIEPGDYVSVGQTLLNIVSKKTWVVANFKETDLTLMKPGDPVSITVDAYPQFTFHGYVQSIQAGSGAAFSLLPPENATGNFVKVVQRVPVKILFRHLPKNMPYLVTGMSCDPEVKVR
jgi:membrane fusion protein (multidrug efflux system)